MDRLIRYFKWPLIILGLLLIQTGIAFGVKYTVMYINLNQTVTATHTFNPSTPGDIFIVGARGADSVVDDLWVEGSRGLITGTTNYLANITPGNCTGGTNSGKLTVNSSNQIVCDNDTGSTQTTTVPTPATRWASCAPTGSTTVTVCYGETLALTSCAASTAASTTQGYTIDCSSGSAGADSGVVGQAKWTTGRFVNYSAHFLLNDVSSSRLFAGLSDLTLTQMLADDNPANGDYVGFRYSTDAGDTNYMCIAKDGTTAATPISTGVAADTSYHVFEVFVNSAGTVATFKIDGTSVCGSSITNLPTAGQIMRPIIAHERRAAGTTLLKWGEFSAESKW